MIFSVLGVINFLSFCSLTFPHTADDYTDLDHIPPYFILQVKESLILHTEAIPYVWPLFAILPYSSPIWIITFIWCRRQNCTHCSWWGTYMDFYMMFSLLLFIPNNVWNLVWHSILSRKSRKHYQSSFLQKHQDLIFARNCQPRAYHSLQNLKYFSPSWRITLKGPAPLLSWPLRNLTPQANFTTLHPLPFRC